MTTAQDGGKVVSLTHWPSLPPGNFEHYYGDQVQEEMGGHVARTVEK